MSNNDKLKLSVQENLPGFLERRKTKDSNPLQQLREQAIAEFAKLPLPTLRDEEWKYTNVAPIQNYAFKFEADSSVSKSDIEKFLFPEDAFINIVFVNGLYREDLSTDITPIQGLELSSLANKPEIATGLLGSIAGLTNNYFVAMNTSFINDGVFLRVQAKAVIEKIVNVVYVTSAQEPIVTFPRNIIHVGSSADVTLCETYISTDETSVYLTNMVTEVVVEKNAVCRHYKIQRESQKSYHISNTEIRTARDSQYTNYNINLGSNLTRNDINARFSDEYSTVTLKGLNVLNNDQHVDNHTLIDHTLPHCESHELYKSVLNDNSRTVFNGKVIVRKDAQKTNAYQQNRTILLSENAKVDTKPQLEIFADDVKCSHGATIGQLDDEQLFYLKSRGFGAELAKALLIYAFADDVVSTVHHDYLRGYLDTLISDKLEIKL